MAGWKKVGTRGGGGPPVALDDVQTAEVALMRAMVCAMRTELTVTSATQFRDLLVTKIFHRSRHRVLHMRGGRLDQNRCRDYMTEFRLSDAVATNGSRLRDCCAISRVCRAIDGCIFAGDRAALRNPGVMRH